MGFYRPDIVQTFKLFHEPGDVVEVRVPRAGKYRVISGYFNDPEAFADAVMSLESGRYPGVYFTINKVVPDLFARSANTLTYYAESTTSDKDGIVCRRWLPIDLDPIRPASISSTDTEHAAAMDLVLAIRKDLISRGWHEDSFILANSGNGTHLMVRIGLANDPTDNLIERCLKALDHNYSNDMVKVDTTLFNASRIIKIYGTTARKGSDIPDRPHRNGVILEYPETMTMVSRDQLEALVAELTPPALQSLSQKVSARSRSFDPVAYAEKHGAHVIKTKPWNGGLLAILKTCPFDSSHSGGEICIGRLENGARFFKCQHDSCKDKDWRALKALWEPTAPLTLADLRLDDLCIVVEKKDSLEYKFDPDKASKAILSTGELQLASWESSMKNPDIWVCVENNVWTRSGEYQIEKICDDVAGSRSTQHNLEEVKRRIKNALRESPKDFDTMNPCLVGTRNGYACNLITGEVRKILPEDYISTELQLPVDYDPEAKCPETFKFHDGVCSTSCEKIALIDFDTSALMLKYKREIHQRLGGGSNGKGIKQQHQRALFGPNTMISMSLKEFTTNEFAMQNLFRKRILTLPETSRMADGKEHSTSALKGITGGDQQDADVKFKGRLKFVAFCKVVMDANTPPRFDDTSAGWVSRYRRENFPYEFTEAPDASDPRHRKLDPHIINRITTTQELSGYLNVLLYRAQTIIRDGVTPKCGHLTEGYLEQVFSLETFVEQFFTFDTTKGVTHGYYAIPSEMFQKFDRWAQLTNGARLKEKAFYPPMAKALGRTAQGPYWIEGKNQRAYVGVKFYIEKYNGTIAELEDALKHSGSCGNSATSYEELKRKFS